jgi:hypothetical protein
MSEEYESFVVDTTVYQICQPLAMGSLYYMKACSGRDTLEEKTRQTSSASAVDGTGRGWHTELSTAVER